MSRNAIYWHIVTLCLACGSIIATSSSNRTNPDYQQVLIDEDDYIAFADSGLRDEFDWQLLKFLSTPNQSNTIISPVSLKILLALLYEGAGGTTEQEIQNVLQFSPNKTIVRQEFSKVLNSLTEVKTLGCNEQDRVSRAQETYYTLNLATRVYIDSNLQPLQSFQSKACEKYNTKIESANFSNADKTSAAINQFANKATLGKISKLVEPDDVKNSVLLFVNALYFRGMWSHQFPKNQSHKGGFYLAPNQAVQVDYMATTAYYFFLESRELEAKIIRIPYKGKKFSMIVILPNAKAGLHTLIQRLNVMKLKQLVNIMDKQSVDLILPKFKFDFQARMSDTLKSMGLVSMFQSTASLPGITRGSEFKLEVSDIIQKSGIEVNEEGSTAFAASNVQLVNKFGDAQVSFNATHPFVFYIEDQVSHTILFLGKVMNPLDSMSIPLPSRFSETGINSGAPTSAVPEQPPVIKPPPQQTVVEQPDFDASVMKRFNYFDLELLQTIANGVTNENIFLSPASIKTTLGMILEGAKDKSASEIANTLRLPLDQIYVREQLKSLLYDTSGQSGSTALFSTNGIFLSNKLKLVNSYLRTMQDYYKATVGSLNYANNAESVNIINNWISTASRGLIPSIVAPETISADSSIVLANAMYFKGIWKYAFDPTLTTIRCFHLANGQCHNAYMMQNSGELNYKLIGEIDAHALEIPYNDEYAMLVLVPQAKNNIQALLRDLQHVTFNSIVDKLERAEVLYEIPRFEIDYSVALLNVLKQLGVREIFSEKANLSGIVQNEKVAIDNIFHKSKIEVNEKGTIAAAATAAIVIPLMGSASPRVIANQPFLFFIYKRDNRNIIFEGIVNKPLDGSLPVQTQGRGNFNVRPGVVTQRQFR